MTLTKDHYIELKDGAFDGTSMKDLDDLFNALVTDPYRKNIVLHFHGGLVSVAHAMQTAENLTQLYQAIKTYQIFFLWETSVSDVIQQEGGVLDFIEAQLVQIGKEGIFQQLLTHVLQFARARINGAGSNRERSIDRELTATDGDEVNSDRSADGWESLPARGQLQDDEKQQFANALIADQKLQEEVQKVVNGYRLKQSAGATAAMREIEGAGSIEATPTLMSPSILEQMSRRSDDAVRGFGIGSPALGVVIGRATEVLSQVITRFSQSTDHGLYATVVEEILRVFYLASVGKHVWDHIKQEAVDAFSKPDRGGSLFLQKLSDYCQQNNDARITLVGHSAGAVYICQLLQKAKDILPANVKFDIVLLAPACTYKLFADTLQTCRDRISSIRAFAMSDRLEQADVIVPDIYTRSLLYLVSGIFEEVPDTPILGMQRFFSTNPPFNRWPEIATTLAYLGVSQHNNVWSIRDGGDGLSSHSQHHGAFYSEDVTLKSLGYILTNGIR